MRRSGARFVGGAATRLRWSDTIRRRRLAVPARSFGAPGGLGLEILATLRPDRAGYFRIRG
ncbi:hypothetical protein GCM10010532_004140 [Dactylosporangium siamense]|uniref:Uncharacterized protein n=1 Tax=Dactylosporangium siamense TaxID=685454 RepID=A0A919PU30_9ACTN|nr:hypothetical protein Dsi01nite_073370 [Dactylosporangium siamense]